MPYACCKCEIECIPDAVNRRPRLLSPLSIQAVRVKSGNSNSIALMGSRERMVVLCYVVWRPTIPVVLPSSYLSIGAVVLN